MSKYKGYLPGINPNYTKKILQDDDDRYFAMDSGRFVNGLGQEVKTMKEAVAANDKIDAEYNKAWPPQKAVGAKPIRAVPGINKKPVKDVNGYAKAGPFESTLNKIIDYAPNKIKRPTQKQKRITPSRSYTQLKLDLDFSGIDELVKIRNERDKLNQQLDNQYKKLNAKTVDPDIDKGLAGIMGVKNV